MQRTRLIFLILLLLASRVSLAQSNFIEGYYINLAHDTIRGLIEDRLDEYNFQNCSFKSNATATPTLFLPDQISAFSAGGDNYESHSFREKDKLSYGFFKVQIRSKLSLLLYTDRYFAKDSTGTLADISRKGEEKDGQMHYDYRGMGQLKILMSDCKSITSAYLESAYKSTPDFELIFKHYLECIGHPIATVKKVGRQPHFDVGVLTSVTSTHLVMANSLSTAKFTNCTALGYGGFVSVFIPKVNEHLRLVVEGSFGQYRQYAYFMTGTDYNDLSVQYSYMNIPVFLRLSFGKFFIDAGLQNQYYLGQSWRWRIESPVQNVISTTDGDVPSIASSHGVLAGLGGKFNLAGFPLRTSVRFSQTRETSHPNVPQFNTVEIQLAFQLTR